MLFLKSYLRAFLPVTKSIIFVDTTTFATNSAKKGFNDPNNSIPCSNCKSWNLKMRNWNRRTARSRVSCQSWRARPARQFQPHLGRSTESSPRPLINLKQTTSDSGMRMEPWSVLFPSCRSDCGHGHRVIPKDLKVGHVATLLFTTIWLFHCGQVSQAEGVSLKQNIFSISILKWHISFCTMPGFNIYMNIDIYINTHPWLTENLFLWP